MQEVLEIWHTEKRCLSQVVLCGRCAGPGHQSGGCISEAAKCGSCGGAHISGYASCLDRKKELTIIEIQKQQKVGWALARQIVETGINIHMCAEERKPYARYIDIDPNEKRKFCPIKVEKSLQTELTIAAMQISGYRKGYTIQSNSEEVSKEREEMKTLMGLTCTVQDHKRFNKSKGLYT